MMRIRACVTQWITICRSSKPSGAGTRRARELAPHVERCEFRQLLSVAVAGIGSTRHADPPAEQVAATQTATSLVDRPGTVFWGRFVYAPFVDMTSFNFNANADGQTIGYWSPTAALAAGVRYFVLAHVDYSWDRGQLTWGGLNGLAFNDPSAKYIANAINQIRAAGGDVSISLGGDVGGNGYNQPEIARASAKDPSQVSENKVLSEYERLIQTYQLTHIDFNIEGQGAHDLKANDLRNRVIYRLEQWYTHTYRPGQTLEVTFTIHANQTYVPVKYFPKGQPQQQAVYAVNMQDATAVEKELKAQGATHVVIQRPYPSAIPNEYKILIRSVLKHHVRVQSWNFMEMHMGIPFNSQTGPQEYGRVVRRTASEIHQELIQLYADAGQIGKDESDVIWRRMGIVVRPGVDRNVPVDPATHTPSLGDAEVLYPGQESSAQSPLYGTGAYSIVNWGESLRFFAPNHQILRSGPRYLSIWSINRDQDYSTDPANTKSLPYQNSNWSSGVSQSAFEFSKIFEGYTRLP